jgi:hypothetical protein
MGTAAGAGGMVLAFASVRCPMAISIFIATRNAISPGEYLAHDDTHAKRWSRLPIGTTFAINSW